jgi:hypothetical protein
VGRNAGRGDRPPTRDFEVVANAGPHRGGERHLRRQRDQTVRRGRPRQAFVADRPKIRVPDDRLEHVADRAGFQSHFEGVCGIHRLG